MSGPKVSIYELSPQQRQNLRAQLSCYQQSLVYREEIKRTVQSMNGQNGQIQSFLTIFELVNGRTGDLSPECSLLTDYQNLLPGICQSLLEELAEIPVTQVDRFTLSEAELTKHQTTLARLQALQSQAIAKYAKIESALAPMADQAAQGTAHMAHAIADDIAGVSSFFVMPPASPEETLAADKKNVEDQLRALSLDGACPDEFIQEIRSAAVLLTRLTSKEQLDTLNAVTIQPLLHRIEAAKMKKQEEALAYAKLRTRLRALCGAAGVAEQDLPPDDGNLQQLKLSVAALEERIVTQTEQAYISDCVNEVMSEMGYDIIGSRSVTKRSGKRFRNELFSYHDGTALNVTYDSEGQIAIELGGIDRTDRIPTAEETAVLQDDMESFCSDFTGFEDRLKEKGVFIKSRISMAPPSAEYAAILNLNDYSITAAAPIQELAVTKKRTKTAAKRAVRKEGN